MRHKLLYLLIIGLSFSCETEVDPSLDSSLNVLVIDAWLTNFDSIQHVNITRSQSYFDSQAPSKVPGASVTVRDLTDNTLYTFEEEENRYTWRGGKGATLGIIGNQYELRVELNGDIYTSRTTLNDVPPIDSISFRLEEGNSFFDDLIFGEVFATDLEGQDDTYWIKAWKNGQFLGNIDEINVAYDAAFSPDADNDGVQFIQPIRDLISPIDESRNEELLSPYSLPETLWWYGDTLIYPDSSKYAVLVDEKIYYEIDSIFQNNNVPDYLVSLPLNDDRFVAQSDTSLYVMGDSVYVEIHSISNEAYFFLNQVIIESGREGGFGALFATPLANVSTNIVAENNDNLVAGFFNIAAVSSAGNRLRSEDQVREVK
ncbi:DUF4249 family protein [Ekhidna sp.]|uniref:DUF4249 family protein n=1 Tax=Ekhidna sp. TaxID=2608089 RepID=UPI003B58E733